MLHAKEISLTNIESEASSEDYLCSTRKQRVKYNSRRSKKSKGCHSTEQIIEKLNNVRYIPPRDFIFKMFEYLPLKKAKVIIIGQDPYPGKCPVTKQYYACGPAFLIPESVNTCPVSLKNMFSELRKEYKDIPKNISIQYIRNCVQYWISQGVFLTNSSLTRGIEGTYLDNHKYLWKEFTTFFMKDISTLQCTVVLLGKEAWTLSKYINDSNIPVLKFHHPASRSDEFTGCKMFSKINETLSVPIKWYI